MSKVAGSIGLLGWLIAIWMMAGLASAQDNPVNWAGCETTTPYPILPTYTLNPLFQTATAVAQGTTINYPPYPTSQADTINGVATLAPEFTYKVVWKMGVNVRRGAGTYYDIIAAVPPEATIIAVGTPTGYVGGYRWVNRKEGGWMAIDSLYGDVLMELVQ